MTSTILKPPDVRRTSQFAPGKREDAVSGRGSVVLKPGVLVVIPCYNEESSVGPVVLQSSVYADNVTVVDDGSDDRTAEIARQAGADVIVHRINKGKGAGVRSAFCYAKNRGADILVLIDGDGQHRPDQIPLLVEPILKGEADLVNGSRFLEKYCHQMPGYRRIGLKVLTWATNATSGTRITDSQSGFRAFSRNTFDAFTFSRNGMGVESEMIIDAAAAGLRIKEVPIDVRYDVDGSTFHPVAHGFSVLGSVLVTLAMRRSILAFGIPGLALLLAGAGLFAAMELDMDYLPRNVSIAYAMVSMLFITLGILCVFTMLTMKSIRGMMKTKPSSP
jgi:glycosyltransferase involved in cell wall biosynthesis